MEITSNLISNLETAFVLNNVSITSDVGVSILNTVENLISPQLTLSESVNSSISTTTINILDTVGQLMLINANIGEEYVVESGVLEIGALRSNKNNPLCSSNIQGSNIQLPNQFTNNFTSNNIDCILQRHVLNIYDLTNSQTNNDNFTSYFINLDIEIPLKEIQQRRLVSYDNPSYLDTCNPILLEIENQNVS